MLDLFSQFANYETLFGALLRWGGRQDIVRQQIDEGVLDDSENILHGRGTTSQLYIPDDVDSPEM